MTRLSEMATDPDSSSLPESDVKRFCAFLTHSSADKRIVRRLHRFIEDYRDPETRERLLIYLDETDIRGGPLPKEIEEGIEDSDWLLVCLSPAAIDSIWVGREIEIFTTRAKPKIAVVTIAGSLLETRDELQRFECRHHDLRSGWRFGIARRKTKDELLRLLAALTGAELRTLVNWHRRRAVRKLLLTIAVAMLPVALILGSPWRRWARLEPLVRAPINIVAAKVNGDAIEVVDRFLGQGPPGFRRKFKHIWNILDSGSDAEFTDTFLFHTRLLPESLSKVPAPAGLPSLARTGRSPAGEPFFGSLSEEVLVFVQPLALTEEELGEAEDDHIDLGIPIPESRGAWVVVKRSDESIAGRYVSSLEVRWRKYDVFKDPNPPSRGLAVAVDARGGIWIGVQGTDRGAAGGLWHSGDSGRSWTKVEGFESVHSIAVLGDKVIVSEAGFEKWSGIKISRYPTRVVERRLTGGAWRRSSTPPYGDSSEVELLGSVGDGYRVVRVDGDLYRQRWAMLWQILVGN